MQHGSENERILVPKHSSLAGLSQARQAVTRLRKSGICHGVTSSRGSMAPRFCSQGMLTVGDFEATPNSPTPISLSSPEPPRRIRRQSCHLAGFSPNPTSPRVSRSKSEPHPEQQVADLETGPQTAGRLERVAQGPTWRPHSKPRRPQPSRTRPGARLLQIDSEALNRRPRLSG